MDFYELLHRDHQHLLELLDDLRQTGRFGRGHEQALGRFAEEATAHMAAEEETLYAALLPLDSMRPAALVSHEEHNVIRWMLNNLEQAARDEEVWPAKLRVLTSLLSDHIDSEEEDLFEDSRERISLTQADELAAGFAAARRRSGARSP